MWRAPSSRYACGLRAADSSAGGATGLGAGTDAWGGVRAASGSISRAGAGGGASGIGAMTTGCGKGSAAGTGTGKGSGTGTGAGTGSGTGAGAGTGSGTGRGSGSNTATGGEGVVGLAAGMATGSSAGLGETTGTCEAQDASITKPARTAHLQKAAPRSGLIKASRSSVWALSKPGLRSRVNRCSVRARNSILLA